MRLEEAAAALRDAYLRLLALDLGFERHALPGGVLELRFGQTKHGLTREFAAGARPLAEVMPLVDGRLAEDGERAFLSICTTDDTTCTPPGWRHLFRNTVMTFGLTGVNAAADPALVRIATPESYVALRDLRADDVLPAALPADPAIACWALVIDDIPVASTLAITTPGGSIVVEHVQTLPVHRRRGHAARLLRALHARMAVNGARAAVLAANAAGAPLYAALDYWTVGFEDVYQYEPTQARSG